MRFRLIPIVTVVLMLTFTVRLGDFAVELLSGETPKLQKSEAFAEEALPKPAEAPAAAPAKDAAAKPATAGADESKKPAEATTATITDEAKPEDDPFVEEYSDEEIKVLQSLSKRRDQLDQRERDLEQRDKLLKAAEKKVDEKVVELANLRKEIEGLLQKQEQDEEQSITQLVKIYESMKPKDAANIFNEMDFDVLLKIVDKMSERRVAPVLAAMDPNRAREVSRRIAEQKALPKATQ